MSYSSTVLADSPSLYWRLGESNGAGTAVDASGNGRDGTYHYGGSGTHLTLGATGGLAGDANTAASFNGLTTDASGVDIAHASWMDVSTLSIECWIKTTDTGFQMLWDRDPGGGQRPWQFRLNSGKFEFVRICNAAGSIAVVTATGATSVNDGTWRHLVSTYDGSTIKLYVNGVLDNGTGTAASGGITLTATDGLRFGWSLGGTSAYGVGFADELAYYGGTVLSSSQVLAHYTAGSTAGPDATVTPPAATASAAAVAPVVSASRVVLPPAATATAAALPPTIGAGGNATVSPPAATATATALPPTITQVIPAGTDTSNSLNGRRRRARASVVVVRPAAATPSRAAVKYDKSVPYPPPTLVNGRPT